MSKLKEKLTKQQQWMSRQMMDSTNRVAEHTELMTLFKSCVEQTRKQLSKQKPAKRQIDFESSMVKLAQQKTHEFTARDKVNILDLFVNSEKVLSKMDQLLFQTNL